ncbi:hypothetical protein [Streptomyces sp. NBC_01497]|uniref:hypothetical protein n=1 Tax=Streptomyces sp. NBC_01497 TaxID=2903885 RepID=UPI002E322EDC|nr:hypothetical protein [Streptomyces sp. NBC_01497]
MPGYGAWGAYAPPKPGTIPLAPLNFGQVLGGGLATFGRYGKQLAGVLVTAFGSALLLGAIVITATVAVFATQADALADGLDGGGDAAVTAPAVVCAVLLGVLGLLALMAAQSVILAACATAVQDGTLGRRTTYRALLRTSLRGARRSFPVNLVVGVLGLIPLAVFAVAALSLGAFSSFDHPDGTALALSYLLMLAATPLVLWVSVRLCLAPVVAVAESAGPSAALRRSRTLVRGNWWRTFGLVAVAGMCAGLAASVINVVLELVGLITVFGAVTASPDGDSLAHSALVLLPLLAVALLFLAELVVLLYPQLVLSVVYVDRRIRDEGLAQDLIRAL